MRQESIREVLRRRHRVYWDRSKGEHLRLEHWPAVSDLLPDCLDSSRESAASRSSYVCSSMTSRKT